MLTSRSWNVRKSSALSTREGVFFTMFQGSACCIQLHQLWHSTRNPVLGRKQSTFASRDVQFAFRSFIFHLCCQVLKGLVISSLPHRMYFFKNRKYLKLIIERTCPSLTNPFLPLQTTYITDPVFGRGSWKARGKLQLPRNLKTFWNQTVSDLSQNIWWSEKK